MKQITIFCKGSELAGKLQDYNSREILAIKDIYNPEDIERDYVIFLSF